MTLKQGSSSAEIPEPVAHSGISAGTWRLWATRCGLIYIALFFASSIVAAVASGIPLIIPALGVVTFGFFSVTIFCVVMRVRASSRERNRGYVSDSVVMFGENDTWRYWLLDRKTGEVIRPPRAPAMWEKGRG